MLGLENIDQYLFHLINIQSTNPVFDMIFPAITDLHKTWEFQFIFVPLLLAALLWAQRLSGLVLAIGLTVALALADNCGSILKHLIERPRPFEAYIEFIQRSPAGGFSFPSNHAVNMWCMAFFLFQFFPKQRWLFFAIAILISFSRIYNGVHYPSDVLGGAILGGLFGTLIGKLTLRAIDKMAQNKKEKAHG